MKKSSKQKPSSSPKRTRPAHKSPSKHRSVLIPEVVYKFFDAWHSQKFSKDEKIPYDRACTTEQILPFIESYGDFTVLRALLKQKPELIGHPVVLSIIDYYIFGICRSSWAPHPVEQEEIQWALEQILEGLIQGLLPGYTLTPPKRRRGAPSLTWEIEEKYKFLLHEYEEVLSIVRDFSLRQLDRESRKNWRIRLIEETIPDIWKKTSLTTLASVRPDDLQASWNLRIIKKALPHESIQAWANEIMNPYGPKGTSTKERSLMVNDYLAYCLVGFNYDLDDEDVKYRIDKVRITKRTNKKKTKSTP